jgi:hypothetical protein
MSVRLAVADVARELTTSGRVRTSDGRVIGTRWLGRRMVEHWHAGANVIEPPDVLDFAEVRIASSPFLDELHKAWPRASIENAVADVAETWAFVVER